MKKTIKNEKGYALLVVLFLIVFIITVSTVFMRGNLSNAMQEQRVDQNHLAVVAAEMGVDYYIGKINNEERKMQERILNKIHGDIVKFNTCGGKSNLTIPGCLSVKPIETILFESKTNYLKEISKLVEEVKNSPSTNIEFYSTETNNFESSPYSYQIDKDEVSWQEQEGDVVINLGILGTSKAEMPKLLKTKLSFDVPGFVIRKSSSKQEKTSPKSVFDFFKVSRDYEKKVGCNAQNGHCLSGKYYSEGDISANNPNNQGGLLWVHNGHLNANNMNQFNFTLITRLLTGSNMNKMKGKLILLGEENQKGRIPQNISVKFQSGGKICINVDGFSKSDIEKIAFDKPAQVFFYSSKENPVWPSNASRSTKRTGSLVDFVNECVGQPLIVNETSGGQYEVLESALNLVVDVSY